VEQARLYGDGVHAHLGKELGYGKGMGEVRVARCALLAGVMAGGKLPRAFNAGEIVFGTGFVDCSVEALKAGICRGGGRR